MFLLASAEFLPKVRLFLPEKLDMAEIINQIPGYEKGRVQRITATDEVSESISGAERLTAKYFQDHPEKGREWIASRLEGLSRGMGIPVILVRVHEDQSEKL